MSANPTIVTPQLEYLRPMQTEDLTELMVGELASYPYPWTRGNFEDCLSNKAYYCWVFEQQQSLLGHVVMSVVLKEAHILNICLYPQNQNKGWGRKLLNETEIVAKNYGAETCFLEVRPSNKSGLHLYQAEAYNEIGLRKNYYPGNNGREDAIVMAKTLIINSL
ncbi:MAG: ribosomal-protein-alanine N-acetyltransferase [Cocleimonas sp.]|jgi:ribosomal-protein-alanine N-acetyltransferase